MLTRECVNSATNIMQHLKVIAGGRFSDIIITEWGRDSKFYMDGIYDKLDIYWANDKPNLGWRFRRYSYERPYSSVITHEFPSWIADFLAARLGNNIPLSAILRNLSINTLKCVLDGYDDIGELTSYPWSKDLIIETPGAWREKVEVVLCIPHNKSSGENSLNQNNRHALENNIFPRACTWKERFGVKERLEFLMRYPNGYQLAANGCVKFNGNIVTILTHEGFKQYHVSDTFPGADNNYDSLPTNGDIIVLENGKDLYNAEHVVRIFESIARHVCEILEDALVFRVWGKFDNMAVVPENKLNNGKMPINQFVKLCREFPEFIKKVTELRRLGYKKFKKNCVYLEDRYSDDTIFPTIPKKESTTMAETTATQTSTTTPCSIPTDSDLIGKGYRVEELDRLILNATKAKLTLHNDALDYLKALGITCTESVRVQSEMLSRTVEMLEGKVKPPVAACQPSIVSQQDRATGQAA